MAGGRKLRRRGAPSPLLDQHTRLVYQTKLQRLVVHGVEPGSLAHAMGLRTGDRLESVDGMIIHDLDSALRAHMELGDATALEVRIQRGTQWLDFTYTFVP
jgi:S1-C subfamily serine protease